MRVPLTLALVLLLLAPLAGASSGNGTANGTADGTSGDGLDVEAPLADADPDALAGQAETGATLENASALPLREAAALVPVEVEGGSTAGGTSATASATVGQAAAAAIVAVGEAAALATQTDPLALLGGLVSSLPLVGQPADEEPPASGPEPAPTTRSAPAPFLSPPRPSDPALPSAYGHWAPAGDPVTAQMLGVTPPAGEPGPGPEGGARERALLPVALLPPPPLPPFDASSSGATIALGVTLVVGVLSSLYSRFQKHTLLLSRARAELHARIQEQPGATIAELVSAAGLGRSAVVHHCQMLEKHGLLVSRHDGLHRRLYLPGKSEAGPRPPTSKERRILVLLQEEGPLTQSEIASRLGVSRQAVHQQVGRMAGARRIVPDEADGERRWRPVGQVADADDETLAAAASMPPR